ncbi:MULTISPECIES: hypothetical protein [unclassified Paenibacillus]|uniref:hypothetical protein n=1 Tax=unclassified Paenibacillus TaxID=185978 RepID=UPI002780BA9C|nr:MULTISPECIES: hypothetical protein [unclassified Paenibacillus]MDQ0899240.1 hypothetical protein [Paenibacillus sp. V4I7]MDQ0914769.1 hypothetical protein [Paenibacillus sp. V4I5]
MKKSGNFKLKIRTQFSFHTNDHNLNRILNGIANGKANITAYCQTQKNKMNSVKLVVGSSDSENFRENNVVREVLRSLGIMFREKKVIQILNIVAGIPGVIRSIYGALFRKVKVSAFYDGEENASIVSVSNIKLAIQILKKLAIS